MAVTLISYPVTISSGKVRNIFAGFNAVELEFKREDIAIINGDQSAGSNFRIYVAGDIRPSLNVGEWVYVYTEGTTYTYDGSFQIVELALDLTNTRIELDTAFIENTTGGYLNYKQNWFLESKLVSPTNSLVKKYPRELESNGNPNGVVRVNTSMLVDFLKNEILENSGEVIKGREDCKVMWREVWREDDTQVFALIDQDPIIITYAAEDAEIEQFINGFDVPKLYAGYPFYINLLHSVENTSERISVSFNELDINAANISLDNLIVDFDIADFGFLQANFEDKTKEIEGNTRFITFNANTSSLADYDPDDFESTDYETGT
jgi:hypothetical protein